MPENYYSKMLLVQNDLRKRKILSETNENLIPIPSIHFYNELLKRSNNNNEKFKEEYNYISTKYLKPDQLSKFNEISIDETKVSPNEQTIRDLTKNPLVNFFYDGYDSNKRYINISLIEKNAYWRFIFENSVHNIILLEDRFDEVNFNKKYSFLFERENLSLSSETGLDVQFTVAYRYTNFSLNVYAINSTRPYEESERPHEVKIYRFWAYDPINNIPTETNYFIKMIQIINFNNPVNNKAIYKYQPHLKRNDNQTDCSNYVIHSNNSSRIFSFIIYDITADEFRMTDRFCIENAFKKLNEKQNIKSFFDIKLDKTQKITMDQYLYAYANSLLTHQSSSDTTLVQMETHYKNIMKIGIITKKAIIVDYFACLLKNAYADRTLRTTFVNSLDLNEAPNYFKFNLFDVNELVLILNEKEQMDNDELLDYILSNQVDLVVSVNQKLNNFNKFKKIKLVNLNEKKLSSGYEFLRKQINIKLDLGEMLTGSSEEFNRVEHTFTYAHIESLTLKLLHSNNPIVNDLEYSKETRDFLIEILLKTFTDPTLFHERTLVICDDEKIASILLMCIIMIRQAQIEGTINVNMTAKTVLTKIPKNSKKTLPHLTGAPFRQTFDLSRNEHEIFFKSFFDMPEYELLNLIAVELAEILDTSNKSKSKFIDSQKPITQITSI